MELSDRDQAELEATLLRGESLFSSDTLARLAGRLKRRRSVENMLEGQLDIEDSDLAFILTFF